MIQCVIMARALHGNGECRHSGTLLPSVVVRQIVDVYLIVLLVHEIQFQEPGFEKWLNFR